MKIAVVGLGAWSLKILKSLPPGTDVVGVLTRRPDALNLVPKDCQVLVELEHLAALDVDGIIVANEASKHLPTLRVIWAHVPKMPVFVEKPVDMCLSDVEVLSCQKPEVDNLIFLVDHVQLFNWNLQGIKADLEGVPPEMIRGIDGNNGPFRADCNALWDYGPHAVAIALYLTGFPLPAGGARVRDAWLNRDRKGATVDFELQIGAKTVASLSVGNNAVEKARHYRVRAMGGTQYIFDGLAPCKTPPLTAALQAFCDAIRAGRAPHGDARWGWALPLEVTRVLCDVEKVLATHGTPLQSTDATRISRLSRFPRPSRVLFRPTQ